MERVEVLGQSFGRWTVVAEAAPDAWKHRRVQCLCQCGQTKVLSLNILRTGDSRSCGCYNWGQSEIRKAERNRSGTPEHHNMTGTPEYVSWVSARSRCHCPTSGNYRHYGGRGIYMCDAWRGSFAAFFRDMGPRPSLSYTLGRIDNDGPYSPENCHWATRFEQGRNTRQNRFVTINEETLCVTDWAARNHINTAIVWSRIQLGWSPERAVSAPVRPRRKR